MAIFLTDELSSAFSATEGKTLAYFFCDSAFDKRNTATSIVRGLLLQLIQQHPQLLAYLLPKYTERGQELFNSFDALWTILLDAAADANTGQKYCIIDALDECDRESQNTLLRQLQSSFQGQNAPPNIQILITSRPYDEIHEYMQVFANKDLASFPEAKQDVNRCINEKVGSLAKKKHYTAKLEDNIINVLRKKAEGTFLWVGLACEELEDIPGKDTLKALQDMPKGLHSLYKKLLDRAIGQKYGASEVRKILSSIIACLRPLSLLELSAACKLHEDEDEETRAQFMREQVASCRLMVIVQDEEVLLLHQSVRDFLVGVGADHLIDELEAHAHLAYRCVDLLIQHSNAEQQQRPFHLLEYATTEWTQHARLAHSEFKVMPSQREFFEIESQCREHWLRSYRRTRYIPGNFSILHVAAHWGIQALVEYVFSTIDDKHSHLVNCVDESGATPLKRAVWYGHPSVLSKLLDFGGCATTRALQAAVGHPKDGKVLTAMLLNKRRNEITITEEVLTAAAGNYGNGKEAMAVLLDLRGDEITITGDVVWAAAENEKNGREIIALLLDSRGTKITITEEAVIVIAKNFHKKVIALLLDRRGDEITITEDVVKVAAKFGQDGILDLLAMNSSISVLD